MPLINTSHKEMVQSITNLQADLLKNPYFLYNDKKANIVDYYNLNKEKSKLDESLRIHYSNLGSDSPLRYNVIRNFYLYGLDRVAIGLEQSEMGLQSSEITGEAIILPNTITPYPGDYFSITILKKTYVFKVIDTTPDTFDDGGNYWRIQYEYDRLDDEKILDLTVEEYEFVTGNVGTAFNSIIKKQKWDLAKKLDDVAVLLKKFYKALYFNDKVQTFTYVHLYQVCTTGMNSDFFYDPYLIEFIIQNNVLANDGDKYTYIGHKTTLRPEFPIRYAKSIWRVLEAKELDNIDSCTIESYAIYISDPATIFQTRYENYFELTYAPYSPASQKFAENVQIFNPQVIGHIKENQLFDYDSEYSKYNIIIKYMNNKDLDIKDIIEHERIQEYDMDECNYYLIPMIIFCMESYIKKLMSKTS